MIACKLPLEFTLGSLYRLASRAFYRLISGGIDSSEASL
jgi:hypothetical protein